MEEKESNLLSKALTDLQGNLGTIEQRFTQNMEKKKLLENKKHRETFDLIQKIKQRMDAETEERIQQERYFSKIIEAKTAALLEKYSLKPSDKDSCTDPSVATLTKSQLQLGLFESRLSDLVSRSARLKIEVSNVIEENKEKFEKENFNFRKTLQEQKEKGNDYESDFVKVDKLKSNFEKVKKEFVQDREKDYEALKDQILKELNEEKVYTEVSKAKSIVAKQINELKALCKQEFNSREKSDIEILMAIEKLKEIFEEEIKSKVKITV
ncbi:unnamed protein product [Moneuplotes crassus]|uniref:Uncharacterized protein n=1 Tax=Euplotes crassus TaxID=5936 RepID=A0AAD2CXA1_EUPCR|nr:unnamed protein product [Moneuplotes crassus]